MSAKRDSWRARIRSGPSAIFTIMVALLGTMLGSGLVAEAQEVASPVTVLHDFTIWQSQPISLIKGSDGRFYGTWLSEEPTINCGGVFRMDADGTLTQLHVFESRVDGNGFLHCPKGDIPWALAEGSDGNLYGVCNDGGKYGGKNKEVGTIFRLTKDGVFTLLHNFEGAPFDGATPRGLIKGDDGNFYGTTRAGGSDNAGTVFRMTPEGTVTILHSFAFNHVPTGGARPPSKLIEGRDGLFYGVTGFNQDSIDDYGTVFRISKEGRFKVIYRFSPAGGFFPVAPLMQASDGDFYGTTYYGGSGTNQAGTVFRMTPNGKVAFLHSFHYTTRGGPPTLGAYPWNPLLEGKDGFLYSTITQCGTNGYDCTYRISPSGKFEVLHFFAPEEGTAVNALVLGDDGLFYGDSQGGGVDSSGSRAWGTAFSFKLASPD